MKDYYDELIAEWGELELAVFMVGAASKPTLKRMRYIADYAGVGSTGRWKAITQHQTDLDLLVCWFGTEDGDEREYVSKEAVMRALIAKRDEL